MFEALTMVKESISGKSEVGTLSFKDGLTLLKERFTNPLIFSFIISWLFYNWHATLAILGYQFNQNDSLYGATVYHIIKCHTSWGWPVVFAILYTSVNPIVKNGIRIFYTYINTIGETYNILVSKGGKVEINKYLRMRKTMLVRTMELEKLIEDEDKNLETISTLRKEKFETENEKKKAQLELDNMKYQMMISRNVSFLNGQWRNTYGNQERITETVSIEDGKYYIIDKNGFKAHKFDLTHYHFDIITRQIFFIKQLNEEWLNRAANKDERRMYNNELRFTDKQNQFMSGIENGDTAISYERIMPPNNVPVIIE